MLPEFVQIGRPGKTVPLPFLGDVDSPYLFHALVEQWLDGAGRRIRVAGLSEGKKDLPIIIALEEGNEQIAVAQVSRESFHQYAQKFDRLPEKIEKFADKDEYTADEEWFEKRNARLRIRFDEKMGEYIVPPAALTDMIASYALSSCGEARIASQIIEDNNYCFHDAYEVTLQFYGGADGLGWREKAFVLKKRFDSFVQKHVPVPVEDAIYR